MKKKNKKNKTKKNLIVFSVIAIIIFFIILIILLFTNIFKQGKRKNTTLGVSQTEYKQEMDKMMKFYSWSKQNIQNTETIKKDVFNRLIEQKIIHEFAVKNNIKVDEKELLKRYQSTIGKKTEEEYLKLIYDMYGMSKKDFLQNLSDEILKEKIQTFVKKPFLTWLQEMKKLLK